MNDKQRDAVKRLRELLNAIDEETRLPDEPPLREVVAEHAREQLAKMRRDK